MNSQVNDAFLALFARLPTAVKEQARKAYRLWLENPHHPSLHFQPIQGQDSVWSARVGLSWRVVGLVEGDTITWFWIGSHADYDKLIG